MALCCISGDNCCLVSVSVLTLPSLSPISWDMLLSSSSHGTNPCCIVTRSRAYCVWTECFSSRIDTEKNTCAVEYVVWVSCLRVRHKPGTGLSAASWRTEIRQNRSVVSKMERVLTHIKRVCWCFGPRSKTVSAICTSMRSLISWFSTSAEENAHFWDWKRKRTTLNGAERTRA